MTAHTAVQGAPVRASSPTLVLLPHRGAPDQGGLSPGTPILGLPLVRRTVLSAVRAGYGRIMVLVSDPATVRPLVEGTPAQVVPIDERLPSLPPGRIVLLAPEVLAQPHWLVSLGAMPLDAGAHLVVGEGAAVLEAEEETDLAALLSHARGGGAGANGAGADVPGVMRLRGPQDLSRAEAFLLRGLIKANEGFLSRHVERPISLAITRRLVGTGITPNGMTAVSLGLGFLGAPFFLSPSVVLQGAGALLLWLHSVLDGCDGELARLRFQESRGGGLFDFWGDNLVHMAVFLCMAAGWALAVRMLWPMLLGAGAAAGTLGSAVFVARYVLRRSAAGGPLFTSVVPARASRLSRLLDALGRRDFIYLVIACSVLGKASWFLVMAGLGAPAFFVLLLWSARADAGCAEGYK